MRRITKSTPKKGNCLSRGKCQAVNQSVRGAVNYGKPIINGLHNTALSGNICLSAIRSGCRLGGLLINQHRRLFATPFVAFSLLAFNRTHGVSLPKTLTGAPYGNAFYALLFPVLQSANLYGVAHPLGGGVSFTTNNPNAGESHE